MFNNLFPKIMPFMISGKMYYSRNRT